ncbi:hypothetical protein [Bradyrhizobium sp. Bra64]|uniref:hypothetical protein n=1 Tax=Bradyrhizobium sp. Bra64 TaxID=2926009 RepID=UPI00211879F7|nr:hypothetical protein [Bradyrhizobium sp. Bra64]
MTDADKENLAAGAMSAGVDLTAPTVETVNAKVSELIQHIEQLRLSTETSHLLDYARSAATNVAHYVVEHLKMIESQAKAEIAAVEAKLDERMTSTDVAAAGAATSAIAG